MDQERFDELLLAEIDGRLTLDQRAQLDAACEHDSALARQRNHDLRVARMMRSIAPTRVPPSLAADVMRRYDMEIAGESEVDPDYAAAPSRTAHEEDPFETTSSGSRYRDVYEPYREPVSVRSTTPWWSMILGSTFMRLSFAMSVMILCVYMGAVIMRQSRGGGGSLIPGFDSPSFPESADSGGNSERIMAASLATAEPTPGLDGTQVAGLQNPNPTAIDLNALAAITPLPSVEADLADGAIADEQAEEEAAGKMDPAIERMLAQSSGTRADADAQAATAAAIASIRETPPAATVAGADRVVALAPVLSASPAVESVAALAPATSTTSSKPSVDLSEGLPAVADSSPVSSPAAVSLADAGTQPQAGAGMEKVFDRIRSDLDGKESETSPASSLPPGAREVADVSELRSALAGRETAAASSAASVSTPAPSAPAQPRTELMSEVERLRRSLAGPSGADVATPSPKAEVKAAFAPAASEKPMEKSMARVDSPPAAVSSPVKPAESPVVQNGFGAQGAAPKSTMEDRLRRIEMAIVRNGGTILGRKADSKDPTATRVKALMTRAQIRALQFDLERQGLVPPKKREESSEDMRGGDKPVEFEILVKSR